MKPTPFMQRFALRVPILQAPMAGAVGVELALAVSNAGGLGALSVAMEPPERIRELARQFRAASAAPFNLNLFCYERTTASAEAIARLHARLAPIRAELGISAPGTLNLPPELDAQYEAAIEVRPPIFSFTFGIPRREHLDALRKAGSFIVGTATHPDEARALADSGVDAICAQGGEAGGHRGTFIGRAEDALIGTMALVPLIRRAVSVPVIAAGGIMDGRGIAAALALGAEGAQLGTAFMGCPEAKLNPVHLAALRSPEAARTRVTRAFTGRAARGIVNRMMELLDAHPEELLPYPVQSAAIRDIRRAANAKQRWELEQLWAGQGAPALRALPVAELVAQLEAERVAATSP